MNKPPLSDADIARLLRDIERGESVSDGRRQLRRALLLDAFDEYATTSPLSHEYVAQSREPNEQGPRRRAAALFAVAAAVLVVTASLFVAGRREAPPPAPAATPTPPTSTPTPRETTLATGLRFRVPDGMFVVRVDSRSAVLAPLDEPLGVDNGLVIADVGDIDIGSRLDALDESGDIVPLRSSTEVAGRLLPRWEVSVTQAGRVRRQCDDGEPCLQLVDGIESLVLPASGRRTIIGIDLGAGSNAVALAAGDVSTASEVIELLASVRIQP